MSKYFSLNAIASPFHHPVGKEWYSPIEIEMIYGSQCLDKVEILQEFEVRGDPMGHPATSLYALLRDEKYRPTVWTMRLSWEPKHMCAVFAPAGFDIKKFRHDLALMLVLGVFGKLCNRTEYLNGWHVPASLLSGCLRWGNAEGWWHRNSGVIVVSFAAQERNLLFNELLSLLKIRPKAIRHLEDDYGLVDRVFKKATEIFLDEAKLTPRK